MNRLIFALLALLLSALTVLSLEPGTKTHSPKSASARPGPAPVVSQPPALCPAEIRLDSSAVLRFAKETADRGIMTRLPQIDILNAVFQHYRSDSGMASGLTRVVLSGECFGNVYVSLEKIFKLPHSEKNEVIRSKERPPEIKYSNFHDIILFCRENIHRIDINLERAYAQELPYTFGATIGLSKNIHGTVRSGKRGDVTEVVFDDDQSVLFKPPGIAFFIPDIYTRIARIENRKGEIYGFVIGRPKSAPHRFMTVRYNLTTCAKGSIRTSELSPDDYRRKLADVDFPVF